MNDLQSPGPSPTIAHSGETESLVGLYFRDASRYELLTNEGERRLSRRLSFCYRIISAELGLPDDTSQTFREVVGSLGDACSFSTRCRRAYHLATDSRQRLIRSNLRLAVHIARRYANRGIPMSDVIQDANVGLIKAVERFDPTKGFRFSTYAYWWISEEVKRCMKRGTRLVHTPENVVDEIRLLQKKSLILHQSLGRTPSQSELAHEIEVSPSRIGELRALASMEVSVDAPVTTEGSVTLGDSLSASEQSAPEHEMVQRDRKRTLAALLADLSSREKEVLSRRFGLGLPEPETLQVISDNLGISRERVRQIEKGALKKLRNLVDSPGDSLRG
ncbi:sigma-70 family RNA polymerase sigma factor [Marinobacter orientalis]|uniref:Sigma-70 family RNA polymerase sigma factor n=1 Tax=Marinobacter orientalis TaxID=1928859 RepID=A0A7Y0NL39_9GAMM|nr:sigma-70 family RNA polymerase sigma factor [Marinobacter orientalis]NMT62907.1 sigma-70 family RNA polymerase sigma factor [Marinobacter orientalis]TGX51579.1 sigma-70 family RNA polymerase sigma factor [Marinobacter orientalis]